MGRKKKENSDAPMTEKIEKAISPEIPVVEESQEDKERSKVRKSPVKVELFDFVDAIFASPGDKNYDHSTKCISFVRGVITRDLGMKDSVRYNGAYSKIIIDLNRNEIAVWNSAYSKVPSFVVNNALIIPPIDEVESKIFKSKEKNGNRDN
jgi:hypothetical protein